MPQPLIELGGTTGKTTFAISPATGFIPEVYLPLLPALEDDYHVISVPLRALWGDDSAPPEMSPDYSWQNVADDMLVAYEQYNLSDVVAMGHSMGAVCSLLAAIQRPDLFKAVVMLDSVILPKPAVNWMRQQRAEGKILNERMVMGARNRRNTFPSVDAAFENYKGKSIFADWSDEVLRLYAEHGTVPADDSTVKLRYPPEWEAFYFASYHTDIWDDLPKAADLDIPLLFINGSDSDTFMDAAIDELKPLVPNGHYKTIEGHGHMFPQSAPEETREMIRSWLDEVL